jgi:hypothetical protein
MRELKWRRSVPAWLCLLPAGLCLIGDIHGIDKAPVVVLEESWRIVDQPGAFYFSSPEPPQIDERGFVWVADEGQLLLFSPQGKFIRNFFKKGQGPGELSDLAGFIPESDRVLVFNRNPNKMIVLGREGDVLQEASMPSALGYARLLGGRKGRFFFFREYFQSTGGQAVFLDVPVRLLSAGPGDAEARTEGPWFPKRHFVRDTIYLKNVNFVQIAGADEATFFIAYNGGYDIRLLDLGRMEISPFISRDYRKVKIRPEWKTPKDKFRAPSQTLSGSEVKVFEHETLDDVLKIWVMGGKIWVLTSTFEEAKRLARVDVYDLKADFLGSVMLPVPRGLEWMRLSYAPLTLHDNGVYVLAPTETEALELVRYSLSGLPSWAY